MATGLVGQDIQQILATSQMAQSQCLPSNTGVVWAMVN